MLFGLEGSCSGENGDGDGGGGGGGGGVCLGRGEAKRDKCMILTAFLLLVQTGARMLHMI